MYHLRLQPVIHEKAAEAGVCWIDGSCFIAMSCNLRVRIIREQKKHVVKVAVLGRDEPGNCK